MTKLTQLPATQEAPKKLPKFGDIVKIGKLHTLVIKLASHKQMTLEDFEAVIQPNAIKYLAFIPSAIYRAVEQLEERRREEVGEQSLELSLVLKSSKVNKCLMVYVSEKASFGIRQIMVIPFNDDFFDCFALCYERGEDFLEFMQEKYAIKHEEPQ